MKKERKPIRITGTYIIENGEQVKIEPKEIPAYADRISATVRTLETGIQHSVIA